MPDALFAHPRLAPIYDAVDGARDDLLAYLRIIDELGARTVLDVGCGTGSLAMLLVATGRTVVGVDPAAASLDVAKSKDVEAQVTWLLGDATTLPELSVDVAVMTGNAAQVLLTDDDWANTLTGVHAALRPGGHFVFETRRPQRKAWEDWAANPDRAIVDVPGIGVVELSMDVTEVSLPYVSFRYTYRFESDGEVIVSDSTLRFREQAEIEASLGVAGYRVVDVREAPDRPDREFVFIAERAR